MTNVSISQQNFEFTPLNLNGLESILKSLKCSSPGCDEISMRIFKDNFDILGNEVLTICNVSLKQGIFPRELKMAKVIPIFNAGDAKLSKK